MTTLTGPEKAVLLLLSLEEAAAAPIVGELTPEHIKLLRETAGKMKSVPSNALHDVYSEFLNRSAEAVAMPKGSSGFIRRISAAALGELETQRMFEEKPLTSIDKVAAAVSSSDSRSSTAFSGPVNAVMRHRLGPGSRGAQRRSASA